MYDRMSSEQGPVRAEARISPRAPTSCCASCPLRQCALLAGFMRLPAFYLAHSIPGMPSGIVGRRRSEVNDTIPPYLPYPYRYGYVGGGGLPWGNLGGVGKR